MELVISPLALFALLIQDYKLDISSLALFSLLIQDYGTGYSIACLIWFVDTRLWNWLLHRLPYLVC